VFVVRARIRLLVRSAPFLSYPKLFRRTTGLQQSANLRQWTALLSRGWVFNVTLSKSSA
jgi:hypothetical protein